MTCSIWEKKDSIAQTLWKTGRAGFPIYDMHGHMGQHYAIYMPRCEPADVVKHIQRIGVRKLIFSHHEVLWGNMRNAKVVDICKKYPESLRMYVGIVPQHPDYIKEDLALFDKWAPYAVGLKFLADYHWTSINDKAYEYALDFANERGIPALFHTWGGSPYDGSKNMLKIVQKYKNMKIFLAHCIFGDWEGAVHCAKENSNVYLELTAVPGERGRIEELVHAIGSEHILYGTDMPWFDEYQAVGGVVSAKITEDDMRNILYRNAQRLMGPDF